MAPRKNGRRSNGGRSRKRRGSAGTNLLSRAARRVALTFLTLAFVAAGWAIYLYVRTPPKDRDLNQVVGTAVERAENLYARVPKTADSLRKIPDLVPGRDSAPADPNAEVGKLDQPILIARVVRVVDGDTLLVETSGKEVRVRLLRVNTPESVHPDPSKNVPMGKVASEYTKRRLEGRQVRLEFERGTDRRDQYGRLLCYVFLEDHNFNVELVEEGLSPYYTAYGKSKEFDKEFKAAERSARDRKLGIWGDPDLAKQYEQLEKKWSALLLPAHPLRLAA